MKVVNGFISISPTAWVRASAINLVFVEPILDPDVPSKKPTGYKVLAEGLHKPSSDQPNVYWCLGKYKTEAQAIAAIEQNLITLKQR